MTSTSLRDYFLLEAQLKADPFPKAAQYSVIKDFTSHTLGSRLARDLLNVIAVIPSKVLLSDDLVLHGTLEKDDSITFGFKKKEHCKEPDYAQDTLDEINDILASLADSQLIEKSRWDEESGTLTLANTDDLYTCLEELHNELQDFSPNIMAVLLSSAASFYNKYMDNKENPDDAATDANKPSYELTPGHHAVVRALKSIVSTFDYTKDFTVEADIEEDDGTAYHCFTIDLGENSDTSFEKRFRTLHDIYEAFHAAEDIAPRVFLGKYDCMTRIEMAVTDPKDMFPLMKFLYEETGVNTKALGHTAQLYINIEELQATLFTPSHGLEFRPFQH